MAFLYCSSDGLIVEGNTAFRQAVGIDHDSAFTLAFSKVLPFTTIPDILPDKALQAQFQMLDKAAEPVRLQLQEVMLEQVPVLLVIASEIKCADTAREALAAAETEKKALLKEVYHRVKNNLNIIISLMSLQVNRVQELPLKHLLIESKSRVYTLALLQERLYHSPRLSEVKANEYLLSLTQAVIANFKENKQQLVLVPNMQECWLNVDVLVPLGLVVHELVANAVLHAFKEQESGEIHLQLSYTENEGYHLSVEDTGKGLPEGSSFTSFKSLGAQLVVSLARQLKARVQVESKAEKGTHVSLFFSVAAKHA